MPFCKVYTKKELENKEILKIILKKSISKAASGKIRGVVDEEEVEIIFDSNHDNSLIKELVIWVYLKKTEERSLDLEKRHNLIFENLSRTLDNFSLQTVLSEHEYSEK